MLDYIIDSADKRGCYPYELIFKEDHEYLVDTMKSLELKLIEVSTRYYDYNFISTTNIIIIIIIITSLLLLLLSLLIITQFFVILFDFMF